MKTFIFSILSIYELYLCQIRSCNSQNTSSYILGHVRGLDRKKQQSATIKKITAIIIVVVGIDIATMGPHLYTLLVIFDEKTLVHPYCEFLITENLM